jgi:hypothetical protein
LPSEGHVLGKPELPGKVEKAGYLIRAETSHAFTTPHIGSGMHERPAVPRCEAGGIGIGVIRIENAESGAETGEDLSREHQVAEHIVRRRRIQIVT